MPKQYPCIESTLDIYFRDLTVRLWIDRDKVGHPTEYGVFADGVIGYLRAAKALDVVEFVAWVEKSIPHLNAVQIIQSATEPWHAFPRVRFGTAVYFVPFDETHG